MGRSVLRLVFTNGFCTEGFGLGGGSVPSWWAGSGDLGLWGTICTFGRLGLLVDICTVGDKGLEEFVLGGGSNFGCVYGEGGGGCKMIGPESQIC